MTPATPFSSTWSFSPWLNEHQAHVVDYLREENRLLKQQLRGKRPAIQR